MRQCPRLYARGDVLFRKFHMYYTDDEIKLFYEYCSPMYVCSGIMSRIRSTDYIYTITILVGAY